MDLRFELNSNGNQSSSTALKDPDVSPMMRQRSRLSHDPKDFRSIDFQKKTQFREMLKRIRNTFGF